MKKVVEEWEVEFQDIGSLRQALKEIPDDAIVINCENRDVRYDSLSYWWLRTRRELPVVIPSE